MRRDIHIYYASFHHIAIATEYVPQIHKYITYSPEKWQETDVTNFVYRVKMISV